MRSRSISVVAASVLAACGGAPEIDVDGVWADYVETGVDFPTQEIECTREGVLTLTQDGERFHGTSASGWMNAATRGPSQAHIRRTRSVAGGQCSTAVHVGGLDSADIVFGFTATR